MKLFLISERLLKLQKRVLNIRYASQEPPVLSKFKDYKLFGNKYQKGHGQNERIDSIGWLLLSVPIGTFMLGTWQVSRRKYKMELINDLGERMSLSPVPLPEDLQELQEMEYYPVRVKGEYLYDKEFKIGPRSLIKNGSLGNAKVPSLLSTKSNQGYCIITPFKVENRDLTILINRGWVKARRDKIPEEELGHVPGTVEITGTVRLNEKRPALLPKNSPESDLWYYRDVNAMAELTGSAPIFLDLIASNDKKGPIPGQTRMSLPNDHLTYIITWYSLSFFTAFMWHRLYVKKLPLV